MEKRQWILVFFGLLFALSGAIASAQDFPKGPINYMNPFNPGGEVDIAARAMQPYLEKDLGVSFIINYIAG